MTSYDPIDYKLLSDEPVIETRRDDELQFGHAARVLSRAALYTDSPITIGVFGNWGSGKTSLMRLMHRIVGEEGVGEQAAVPVWFNAWQYEREEHLIIPLIATIARDIKKREAQWEKISLDDEVGEATRKALSIMKSGGEKIHDALRSVLYGISMKGKLGIPHLGELEISTSMKDMIERYEAVTQDTLMARSLYFDAFDQLQTLSHNEKIDKPQIVVFIDDLDRCFPEQAVRLLESVKLVLHQPKFAFVLGIYPQIVEEFIRNKYASQYALPAATAASKDNDDLCRRMNEYLDYFKDYLGKIVQVRHYVPQRRPEQMHNYIEHLLDDAKVTKEFTKDGIERKDLFKLIAEVGKRNPREVVRKINSLIVKWRIAKDENKDGEKYDLLTGLINEAMADRIANNKNKYKEKFLSQLELPAEGNLTCGTTLANALEKSAAEKDHEKRFNELLAEWTAEKDATVRGLLEILKGDEALCHVLSTKAGQKWLSKEEFREETRKTFEEEEPQEEPSKRESTIRVEGDLHELAEPLGREVQDILRHLRMVTIPEGEFKMGSEDGEDSEKPVHKVKVKAFEISAVPVTQALYEAVKKGNPSSHKGPNLPVEMVSWNDAQSFCQQLTRLVNDGRKFRLPSEAEWEYACRAGSTTKYCFGDSETDLKDYAWYHANSGNETHPVGTKKPNEWGLYDMHGNVWEWVEDDWHENYENAPGDERQWIDNPRGNIRVLRGGCYYGCADYCRCSDRLRDGPDYANDGIGFRFARTL